MTQFSSTRHTQPGSGEGFFVRTILAALWVGYRILTMVIGLIEGPVRSIARSVYHLAGPIVARFAGLILIKIIVFVCLLVWAHALLFAYVDTTIINGTAVADVYIQPAFSYFTPSSWGLSPVMIHARLEAAGGWAASMASSLQYLLWPIQFGFVRDLVGVGALFGLFNLVPAYFIWWERKVAGRIQSRTGPMRVGGWHGWAQSIADGIKLILKEDLVPGQADGLLFRAAPYFALIPSFLAFLALPFGAAYMFREMDVALVFILAMLGVEVVGVILAGWASNNKWSMYGAMREACQMISYEIPMGMALLVPVVCVGSLNLTTIVEAQSGGWFTWLAFTNPFVFIAFVIYFIASLASVKRAPFDLPEAESELVAGYLTEYSGFRWSIFFFAEYAAMFVVSVLASVLFLGGWNSPLPSAWGDSLGDGIMAQGLKGLLFSGPIWILLKATFFVYVQIWLRWTLPRVRLDQVLYACIQVLLPITMIILFLNVLWIWASMSDSAGWATFAWGVNMLIGTGAFVFTMGFPVIAAYGFYHRRRMVGSLVQDLMPGS